MTAAQLSALAGIIAATGALIGSITALLVALGAHARIDTIQQAQAGSSPPPSLGPRP